MDSEQTSLKPTASLGGRQNSYLLSPSVGVVSALVVGTLLSLLLVGVRGVPALRTHDEFGYQLSAETFLMGRVTNPTHPMWRHFESFHIIHLPTYTAKYPPLQSVTLAVGQLLGHPIVGVCLATGISIATLVWMLYGWLPPKAYPLAWLAAVLHPGFHSLWSNSYMGGAVALTGASLLLGAFIRVKSDLLPRYGLIAGVGVIILANSRPFEGFVLTVVVAIALLIRFLRSPEWRWQRFVMRILVPTVVVLAVGGGAMMAYNQQVCRSPLKLPYQIHEETYGWNPLFIWQQAGEKPAYRHAEVDRFYVLDKQSTDATYATMSDTVYQKAKELVRLLGFYCGPMILVAVFGLLAMRCQRMRLAVLLVLPVLVASVLSKWEAFHYAAPAAPLLFAIAVGGTFHAWQALENHAKYRRMAVAVFLAFQFVWMINTLAYSQSWHRGNWGHQREEVIAKLDASDGKDLVLVRYSKDHNVHQEWVYNHADIDRASIVWAREINSERRGELMRFFDGHSVWVLEVGLDDYKLTPYDERTANSE